MRAKKSMKNVVFALTMQVVTIVIGFIAQAVFVKILGTAYNGVNGLFTNIISILNLADLGIGTTMIYTLYEPLAKGRKDVVNALLKLYSKVYVAVSSTILVVGLIITPFLEKLIKFDGKIDNIHLIFILFLLDTVVSYLFTYKRSIIFADQKNYIISLVHMAYLVTLNIMQIGILLVTGNYILFLSIKIALRLFENIALSVIADRLYPFLKDKSSVKLPSNIIKDIIDKTKAMMMHRVGGVVVTSTDNLVISKFVGLVSVGVYTNYSLIITSLTALITQVFEGIKASVGNMLALENEDSSYNVFKDIMFINAWIYCFCTISLAVLIEPFISIWIGNQYVMDRTILFILMLNFYIAGMRMAIQVFKETAGAFWYDRYMPLIEASINLVASLILVQYLGIFGVFLGTFISYLCIPFWSTPYFVYKFVFKKHMKDYFKMYIKYTGVTLIALLICLAFNTIVNIDSIYLIFVVRAIGCLLIPNLVYIIAFRKSKEFADVLKIFKLEKFLKKTK